MKGFVKLIAVVVTAAAFAVSCSKDKDSGAVSFDKPAVFIDAPSGMATVGFTLRNIKTLSVTSQPTGWDEPMLDQTTGMLTVIAPSATALEKGTAVESGTVVLAGVTPGGTSVSGVLFVGVVKTVDLSAAGVANSYMASVKETNYLFDVMHKGDGSPLATDHLGVIWKSASGLVQYLQMENGKASFYIGADTEDSNKILKGNAVIGAYDANDELIWSWHVWVTDAPQTMTYGNGTVFMDRNLGAAGTTAGGTDAYGMYYQWGRKDPFYGGEKTETSANAFLEAKNGTVVNPAYPALDWAFSKSATTTDGAAANPMTFYNDKVGTGYNWLASPNATLWGEAKTLNDPCPPGYRVPGTGAWEDLISGRQYIDGVSVWDGTNYGMTYTHGGQTAWYPAQGYRNYSSGAIVGLRSSTGGSGAYWSAETSSVKSYYLFFRSKLSSSGSINNELDMNRSYGYTVRCCKE